MEKVEIESFTLDHTKVKAPYVRLISEEKGPNGDIVSNFDNITARCYNYL